MTHQTPTALTIAGSDSGGGAGIQADIKTFSALGVYGTSVITATTAQNTLAVTDIHHIPLKNIKKQICAVFDDIHINAVKIGMLGNEETVRAVADLLTQYKPKTIIVDPVMIAKSGDFLLEREAITAMKEILFPIADLITPNLPEAAALMGMKEPASDRDLEQLLSMHHLLGNSPVLFKGGHFQGEVCRDTLIQTDKTTTFKQVRIPTRNTHGTGCTLSSAIAALMAKGLGLESAVEQAIDYVHESIKYADELHIGAGHGPLNHFAGIWNNE